MVDTSLVFDLIARDRASATIKGVGTEAGRTSSKMATFHKVGKAAGVAFAVGLAGAGKAAIEFTKRAAEDQQSASRLAQTLTKATGATTAQKAAVEDWITAQGKAYGVADEDLRPALSKLAVATGSVTKAQKLASLAMDVSAGTGKDLQAVSFALAKAQNGNVTGLSRLGVATKNAKGETLSLDQITKNLASTYGGAAAKNAETAAGKQKILTVQMGELQEKIGYALIPALGALVGVGTAVVGWIDNNTTTAGVLVGVLGGLLAVTWAVSAATKAWAAVTVIANAATKAWAAGQWLLNAALTANPIGLVVVAIGLLIGAVVLAYAKVGWFRKGVDVAFHGVLSVASAVFGWIKGHWPLLFAVLGGPIGLATVLIIKNFGKVMDIIHAVGKVAIWLWNNAFQPALKLIVNGLAFLMGIWAKMLGALSHVPGFGWAKGAADAMGAAADRAQALANNIAKIPTHKTSTVVLNVVHNVVRTTGGRVPIGQNARGTDSWRGGLSWVGEEGPELIDLPAGSKVHSATASRGMVGRSRSAAADNEDLANRLAQKLRGDKLVITDANGQWLIKAIRKDNRVRNGGD